MNVALLSKIRQLERKYFDAMTVGLLTEITTKGLMVGWCVYQRGYTGQRDESCPGPDRAV